MTVKQNSSKYHILVIGGNGGIGRQCVQLALKAGHHVTVLLRTPSKLQLSHPDLEIFQGDVTDPASISKHLQNKDAIISAVGLSGGMFGDKPTTLYSDSAAQILASVNDLNDSHVFLISASAVEISPVLPFFTRLIVKYIIQKLLKHMYADLLRMEAMARQSSCNWTIIRPPQLTDHPETGIYRVAINSNLKNGFKISRADVAHFIIQGIYDEATSKSTIKIAY